MTEETKKITKEEKKVEETPKQEEKKQTKEAKVRGLNLHISKKHSVAICIFIKNKKIKEAISLLEKVLRKEIAVPMKGEIPHRKNISSGRYPEKASKEFIKLLKSLDANCKVAGIEDPYIFIAKADRASRPYRRFGSTRFKRTNVLLTAKDKKEIERK